MGSPLGEKKVRKCRLCHFQYSHHRYKTCEHCRVLKMSKKKYSLYKDNKTCPECSEEFSPTRIPEVVYTGVYPGENRYELRCWVCLRKHFKLGETISPLNTGLDTTKQDSEDHSPVENSAGLHPSPYPLSSQVP